MKKAKNLLVQIADIDNLRFAFWKASRGKRHSENVLFYQSDLDNNLLSLREDILSGEVKVGNYHYFKIYEPKERQICASAFSEQVLHHALMNICHQYFEKVQIFDSYASRKDKGTHKCIIRAKEYTLKYSFFLKLDVRKFFDSIHHQILKQQLSILFAEQKLLSIFYQIIDSYTSCLCRGLPIGNLTSQYFANHYLANFDHYIKENLQCKAYVRYMDDMVLWNNDKETLKKWRNLITNYVSENLFCDLKPSVLNYTCKGVPFLGYRIFSAYIRLLHKSKIRFIRKFRAIALDLSENKCGQKEYQRKILPLLSFILLANSKSFRKSVILQS